MTDPKLQFAAPEAVATSADPRIAALESEVASLKTQLASLQQMFTGHTHALNPGFSIQPVSGAIDINFSGTGGADWVPISSVPQPVSGLVWTSTPPAPVLNTTGPVLANNKP